MLVLLAPGQGAQTPGFLTPWLELPGAVERLRWWSAVTGLDLIRYGTTAEADEIRDTAVAQPLLVASGLIGALALFPHPTDGFRTVGASAGHSVGELTVAAGTGVISTEAALALVAERGRAMAAASAQRPTGMTAVLGGDPQEVSAKLDQHGLTAANNNGAGQVVAAGTVEQLAALAADPPPRARLRPLRVAGAFHTHHMAPAADRLAELVPAITVHDPRVRLLSNADGAVVHDGHDMLSRIVSQVASPVRWDACMRTMADLGVTAVIEVPPAGTLTGLVRRALPGVETLALKTPADLPAAADLISRHVCDTPIDETPSWRLVIAPFAGTFHLDEVPEGTSLLPGASVGSLTSRRERQAITVPHGGTVLEWLVADGDPVSPGQPLVRLHPEAVT